MALCVLSWTSPVVVGEARRPPNYHNDHMPDTSFTCEGKVVGGYYADPDADCQMFHVCVQVDEHDVSWMIETFGKFECANWQKEKKMCASRIVTSERFFW